MSYEALQDKNELQAFCDLLAAEGVKSYLEIGSKYGGSLYKVAKSLPRGSRVVSIDTNINGLLLQGCINDLMGSGYDAWLIPLSSQSEEAFKRAEALGPYDALFIDGDHRPAGVMHDWETYGPLARIVAFHDVGWNKYAKSGKLIEVPKIWNKIKTGYRHQEIIHRKGHAGIGVLWRS